MSSDALNSETASIRNRSEPQKEDRTSLRRRIGRRIGISVGIIVLVISSAIGWLTHKALDIQDKLNKSQPLFSVLQSQLLDRDFSSAKLTLDELRNLTSDARASGTDPIWRAAGYFPILGPNFAAVTEATVTADDVLTRAVSPLVSESSAFDWASLAPLDGRVNSEPIAALSPTLSAASNTVALSHDRLSRIERSALLPQIAGPLSEATEAMGRARAALEDAAAAAEVLPAMLGASEPRAYLLLIQNSAEIRTTGGIPGALAVVRADDGRIELTDQSSATELGRFEPAVVVDEEQSRIYSTRIGQYMQSVNLTPDFPTAAQTAAEMWQTRNGDTKIDGVIALDTVTLSHVLKVTGPVELSFEDPISAELLTASGLPTTLTAENVIPTLLSDVYSAIERPEVQDVYFASVAAEIFEALSTGAGDRSGLIGSLIASAEEGRLYVWSADPNEQAAIVSTGLSGSVTGTDTGGAAFGAYFNDGTGAKMDYYIRRTAQLHRSCTSDGYLRYTLIATLKNTAPTDAAKALPAYVTGGGMFGVPAGTVQTNIVGYGPDRAQLQTARIDGIPVPLGSYRHGERPVGVLTTNLAPGQTATVELDFTNVVQTSEPILDVTPTIQPIDDVILPVQGDMTCGQENHER
jgi:hypothetical protein